ncbi:MAG TPA: hypothetical protein VK886_15095 [Vicinamibacterales bacterium]|nr:hypothetical protein [Vicinamibacterales bacterium]
MFRETTRRLCLFVACLISVTSIGAHLAAQEKPRTAPPAKGETYDVEFVFDQNYTGTMMLRFVKGSVTGTMVIDAPTRVDGEVVGTLKGNALVLEYGYTMREQACTGRVRVDATMTGKRAAASGTARASGCSDEPLDGTVTLKRVKP